MDSVLSTHLSPLTHSLTHSPAHRLTWGSSSILKLPKNKASTARTSILANDCPTQLRGPSLKGMKHVPLLKPGSTPASGTKPSDADA
jgi:hypothetical protein